MADIFHQFTIMATAQRVFQAVSTPAGLDVWWTLDCSGKPELGAEYELGFGPQYNWRAVVSRCLPDKEFELEMTDAQEDWLGTRVGFVLAENEGVTTVHFYHAGWPEPNEHFRISSYCWATYLRLLKRYLEYGQKTPYEARNDV